MTDAAFPIWEPYAPRPLVGAGVITVAGWRSASDVEAYLRDTAS